MGYFQQQKKSAVTDRASKKNESVRQSQTNSTRLHGSSKEFSVNDAYNNRDKFNDDDDREVMNRNVNEILGNTSTSNFAQKRRDINFTNS